jgi:predicted GNAT family acetyltransferase
MDGVRHEPDRHRFVLETSGGAAVLEYRQVGADKLAYYRTFVPTELRGRGIASVIADRALRHARDAGLKVIPSCPFVATYIDRNPEYRELVAR